MREETNQQADQKSALGMISMAGDHACLGSLEKMCPVNSVIASDMVLVSNNKHLSCRYYKPFGYSGFCTLPVRKEIYEKYRI